MRYMEPGLGYYYPAGTPAPRTETVRVYCKGDCDYEAVGKLIHDLGTADLVVDGKDTDGACPNCGYDAPPMGIDRHYREEFDYGPDPDYLRDYYGDR